MKKSELRTLRTDELCLEYAQDNINQPNVRAVLTEEGMVRDRYWDHIDRKTLSTGMNECETLAVYGKPDETKTIISILGRREKWIWRSPLNGSNAEPKHAYFRDGIVTSLGKFR